MSPAEVVDEVTRSGLRGRGGAGYPTGLKWATVAKMPPGQKYVVCNADEGDPGAFMDRSVLESDPHRVLEGMAIAAYAVGADQGYIYVRGEYPLAIARLDTAIRQAKRLGLLGSGIFDSPFNFRVDLRIGAGRVRLRRGDGADRLDRGPPRHAAPPAALPGRGGPLGLPDADQQRRDLRQRPADPPRGRRVVRRASAPRRARGPRSSPWPARSATPGWSRCRWASPLRTIVEEIGGGAARRLRPSRRCRPAAPPAAASRPSSLDTPVDYESLKALGSIMGSGGMIVMDQDDDMVDVAQFFMEFCMDESCGKCVPCRAGTVQMLPAARPDRAGDGHARPTSQRLEALCDMVKHTSLCGLGQSAPNPVLSTLRYFRHEYELAARAPTAAGRGRPADRALESAGDAHGRQDPHARRGDRSAPARTRRSWRPPARPAIRDPDALPPRRPDDVGACRLCLVEVNGRSCMPSCVTRAAEEMVVRTDTDRLREYRKMIVELLFAERNHVCSVCVANGNCELQYLADAARRRPRPLRLPQPELRGRRLARALRPRPQPLHPLHPLRPGLRRDRGGPHLGRRRPRDDVAGHHRPAPALGDVDHLHLVRQVRDGLPDRRPLPPGLDGRRERPRPRHAPAS